MGNEIFASGNHEVSRRHFVKQSALLSGSLVLSSILPGSLFASPGIKVNSGIVGNTLLSEGWKIKALDPVRSLSPGQLAEMDLADESMGWLNIPSVPAMPHRILLHHKKIEEPWKPLGMEKCYWVSQKDWVYAVKFKADNPSGEQRLVFKELKGHVKVYLNGELLASHSDQAHPLVLDVTGKLNPENQLVLHFEKAAPDAKPGQPDPAIRKKNGTYLGPNPMLYTSGMVGEVILERTDGHLMEEIITDFSLNDTFTKGKVIIGCFGKKPVQKGEHTGSSAWT